jgi:hypothetical protein
MKTPSSESGFTLLELLLSTTISLIVMGVAMTTFRDAVALNDTVVNSAGSSQNLRTGANLLVRDLLQAGRNIPIGGIAIPTGPEAYSIKRPSPPGLQYYFNNDTAATLEAITTGFGLGPTVSGRPTDIVTIVMDDPTLPPLLLKPSSTSGSIPKLASDGSFFTVGTQTSWIAGDLANGIAPVKPGDLIYFLNAGTALQTVTKVTSNTVYFEQNDAFNLNQRWVDAGSITQILGSDMTARRVLMYTYYIHADTPGVPRLKRVLNHFAPQALAGVVEDLEISYDLVDRVSNPTNVRDLPYVHNGLTYTSSQIRKANVHIGVRSETWSDRDSDYFRNHVSTVVGIRNLAHVDRYK